MKNAQQKKTQLKKKIPPWAAVVAIIAVVVVIAVVWFGFLAGGTNKTVPVSVMVAKFQGMVDKGAQPPIAREALEKMGVKYPANFAELQKKYQADLAAKGISARGRGRAPLQETPTGR